MKIGIDASRAFLSKRTGIEEYSYQVIRHLRSILPSEIEVILYIKKGQIIDFNLPNHWKVKELSLPRLWTQGRLSWEMLFHAPDLLFVPAHTIPLFHPKRSFVTIHGLEYEFCPEGYSFFECLYMRWSIRFSCRVAQGIIAVSENTKKDLKELYGVAEDKITVIPEGFSREEILPDSPKHSHPYFFFVGRLENRKNIIRIVEAFEIFKKQRKSEHQLLLAGKFGYGRKSIQEKIEHSPIKRDIILLGYISEKEKWELLKNADIFLFPTLYEGFGIPVLEAQSVGVPVITSTTSSLPEVAGEGAVFVDPTSVETIAGAIEKLVSEPNFRAGIIKKATHNVDRFSWERCAQEIASFLI